MCTWYCHRDTWTCHIIIVHPTTARLSDRDSYGGVWLMLMSFKGWMVCDRSRDVWMVCGRSRDVWMVPIDREMCGWYRKKNERCLSAIRGISSQVHTNTCQCQLTMMGSRSPTNYLLGIQLFPTRPCHTTHFGIPYHTIKPPVGQDTIPHSITAN